MVYKRREREADGIGLHALTVMLWTQHRDRLSKNLAWIAGIHASPTNISAIGRSSPESRTHGRVNSQMEGHGLDPKTYGEVRYNPDIYAPRPLICRRR